jgi:hypothetical protein
MTDHDYDTLVDRMIARWWEARTGVKPYPKPAKSHVLTFYAKADMSEYDRRDYVGNGWFRYTRALNWDEGADPRTAEELAADIWQPRIEKVEQ